MAARNPDLRRQAAKAGAAARWADPETAAIARRDLAAARLDEYVKRVVDSIPPLTPAQRDRIVAPLWPSASADTSSMETRPDAPERGKGPGSPPRPHTAESSHRQEAAPEQLIAPDPPDGPAGILAVLTADDARLVEVLRQDVAVRHALRWRHGDRDAEMARTLVAAARVERRRRRGARVLADVLAAVRGDR